MLLVSGGILPVPAVPFAAPALVLALALGLLLLLGAFLPLVLLRSTLVAPVLLAVPILPATGRCLSAARGVLAPTERPTDVAVVAQPTLVHLEDPPRPGATKFCGRLKTGGISGRSWRLRLRHSALPATRIFSRRRLFRSLQPVGWCHLGMDHPILTLLSPWHGSESTHPLDIEPRALLFAFPREKLCLLMWLKLTHP
eukprot:scaffold91178_cov26-Tisochrysis_lutea.AAC.1